MFTKTEEEEFNGRNEKRSVKCSSGGTVCSNILIAVIPTLEY